MQTMPRMRGEPPAGPGREGPGRRSPGRGAPGPAQAPPASRFPQDRQPGTRPDRRRGGGLQARPQAEPSAGQGGRARKPSWVLPPLPCTGTQRPASVSLHTWGRGAAWEGRRALFGGRKGCETHSRFAKLTLPWRWYKHTFKCNTKQCIIQSEGNSWCSQCWEICKRPRGCLRNEEGRKKIPGTEKDICSTPTHTPLLSPNPRKEKEKEEKAVKTGFHIFTVNDGLKNRVTKYCGGQTYSKSYLLFISKSNLSGPPVFLFAKSV